MDTDILLIREPISKNRLKDIALQRFGDLVKAVVDIEGGIMAIGGELHADEQAFLIEQGSRQENLWGINIYPDMAGDQMIEFDSMINIRPSQNNRSRSVEDLSIQSKVIEIVGKLVQK